MFELFGGVFKNFGDTWFGAQIDTFVDKLNRNVTVAILVAMTIMVSAKQYVGDPIHCRPKAATDGNFEKYMDHICWITNTYIVDNDVAIGPEGLAPHSHNQLKYYQWVPLILLTMAAMFYLPHIIWQAMLTRSGLDLKSVMQTGRGVATAENKDEREKMLGFMAGQLDNYLRHYQDLGDNCWTKMRSKFSLLCSCICGKRGGSFITFLYMLHKVLYMVNVVGQIIIMERLLTPKIHQTAWTSLTNLFYNNEWPESEIFPRQTLCQFDLREQGTQTHRHIVQCVLSINFFHEKVFIVIWLWIMIVAVCTGLSIVAWTIKFIFRVDRVRFVKKYLKIMGRLERKQDRDKVYEFIQHYLRQDGVFALRLVNLNVSGLVTGNLVAKMWDDYRVKGRGKGRKPLLDDVDASFDLHDSTTKLNGGEMV